LPDSEFKKALASTDEVNITVTGRKSGKKISLSVWFALSEDRTRLYLLPVKGSKTNWYRNILKNTSLQLSANGNVLEGSAKPSNDPNRIADVREMFTQKYGQRDVKKYYSTFDACVFVDNV
jgi:hypothetical protein